MSLPSKIDSAVVSIDHVRFILLLTDLKDLEVIAADIINACLHRMIREKLLRRIDVGKIHLKGKENIR